MFLLLVSSLSFFGPPKLDIGKGRTIGLYGKGPPVVFSTGLYGAMPKFLYDDLFRKMSKNVTLVKPSGPGMSEGTMERICDALGVKEVGFFSHSSFDPSVLSSPRIKSAVLCDPVCFPSISPFGVERFASPSVSVSAPVLVLRAENTYAIDPPIPDYLSPSPYGDTPWRSVTLPGVGHADLLDNVWADIGAKLLPWINGPSPESKEWKDWEETGSKERASKKIRDAYRKEVASLAANHLLEEGVEVLAPI